MSALAGLTMAALVAASAASSTDDALAGAWDCTAVTGNRGLTVCLDAGGRVGACRWPDPSQWDQVDSPGAIRQQGRAVGWGLMWGFRRNAETVWLTGELPADEQQYHSSVSPVVHTVHRFEDGAWCEQDTFVLPDRDVLATRLRLHGFDAPPDVYWYANHSPCTRSIPGVPAADWLLDSLNDLAVFVDVDGRTVCHFRPEPAEIYEHEYARELARIRAKATAWESFDDGVWIAGRCQQSAGVHCGADYGDKSVIAQAEAGWLAMSPSASGQCASVMVIRPDAVKDGFEAVVYTAFAASRDEARAIVADAGGSPFQDRMRDVEAHWDDLMAQAVLPATARADLTQRSRRALMTLLMCTGRERGATVRVPGGRPMLACDWPRDGVWVTEALARSGMSDLAAQRMEFYAGMVRAEPGTGIPEGSLPAAAYGDGTEAAPGFVLDVEACAWFLWALDHHARLFNDDARQAYLARMWDTTELAGSFLSGWTDTATGDPLPSFERAVLRDDRTDALVRAACVGMRSAVDLASMAGHDRPEWRTRAQELEPRVRAWCLNPDGSWKVPNPLVWWPTEVVPPTDERWETALDREVARLASLEGVEAARALYAIGAYLQVRPDLVPRARAPFRECLTRVMPDSTDVMPGQGPDTLQSALCYLATSGFYEAETRLVENSRRDAQ